MGEKFRCTWCHRGNALTSRKELAHHNLVGKAYAAYRLPATELPREGGSWLDIFACRRCHVHKKHGNVLATNLDQLLSSSSVEEIKNAISAPAFYMPDFSMSDRVNNAVITQILRGGLSYKADRILPPTVVHFSDNDEKQSLFEKHCGSCHRVLTAHHGGLGVGVQGPNLSGLLGKFYPHNYRDGQPWTLRALNDWLTNPRKIRPLTTMPALIIDKKVQTELIDDTWPQ